MQLLHQVTSRGKIMKKQGVYWVYWVYWSWFQTVSLKHVDSTCQSTSKTPPKRGGRVRNVRNFKKLKYNQCSKSTASSFIKKPETRYPQSHQTFESSSCVLIAWTLFVNHCETTFSSVLVGSYPMPSMYVMFTHISWIFMVKVGTYTSPMDPMGKQLLGQTCFCFFAPRTCWKGCFFSLMFIDFLLCWWLMTYDSYDYLASRVPFPMVDSLIRWLFMDGSWGSNLSFQMFSLKQFLKKKLSTTTLNIPSTSSTNQPFSFLSCFSSTTTNRPHQRKNTKTPHPGKFLAILCGLFWEWWGPHRLRRRRISKCDEYTKHPVLLESSKFVLCFRDPMYHTKSIEG